ncbi:T9SS type A sorting domain-containing protein [Psychroserpens sp. MEBiC05023]
MKKMILFFTLLPLLGLSQVQIGQDIDGENASDRFGNSVCLSSDGSILAAGGFISPEIDDRSGYVKVYENIGGVWTQIGGDIEGENPGDFFGWTLDLSSDGNIVAIGAWRNSDNVALSGHVRVYENVNGIWTQIGQDIEGENVNDGFGSCVSLSSDGTILAASAYASDANGLNNSGQVKVYENIGGVWTQIGNDINGEEAGDYSGGSNLAIGYKTIELASDGSIIAIGAGENDGNGFNSGHVRVYENIGGEWTQIGEDIDGEAANDHSGVSISLSSDGSIVAIGARANDKQPTSFSANSGHVRVYENINGNWTQIGEDIDGENGQDASGTGLSLSSDGSIIAIGAGINDGVNGDNSGHVRIYKFLDGEWTQIGEDIDGEAANNQFGIAVSLNSSGNMIVIGAPSNSDNGTVAGSVRTYDLSALLSIEELEISSFQLYPNPTKTQFTIEIDNSSRLEKVSVYNTLGQVVLISEELIVNTSKLASGSYMVEVLTNKGKSLKKLIIE